MTKADLVDEIAERTGVPIEHITRRRFFRMSTAGVGAAALGSLLSRDARGQELAPHFAPKAKRMIYLFMNGGASQMDLYDYKPKMQEMFDKDLPPSIINGQRLTTMTSGQSRFPVAPSAFKFKQHGQSGAWISELLPNIAKHADKIFFKEMIARGKTFVWCSEGYVFELVPPERQSRTYYLKRGWSRGVGAALETRLFSMSTAKSVVAIAAYTAALPILLGLGQHLFMRYLVKDCDHISKLLGHFGIRFVPVKPQ
jgi:hypothetical protein